MMQTDRSTQVLNVTCADRPGLTTKVTGFLFHRDANILEAHQFNDPDTGQFFMRIAFDARTSKVNGIISGFESLARAHSMEWMIARQSAPRKTVLMVSKLDHCLSDLLYRQRIGELAMDPVAIISNHPLDIEAMPLIADIPYHHLPVRPEDKEEQEEKVMRVIDDSGADLVVLARYMQILSDDFAAELAGRCINIHHSFLPGFKGGRPYHQAHERGVKMIGATAHYVTSDLDEGPIIHQDVEPVTHADTTEMMVRKGRDIERRVLAEAVRLHIEDRVLINGNKTVVFR